MKKLLSLLVVLSMFGGVASAAYLDEDFSSFPTGSATGVITSDGGVTWERGLTRATPMYNVWNAGDIPGSTGKTLGVLGPVGNGSVGAVMPDGAVQADWINISMLVHEVGDDYVQINGLADNITGGSGFTVVIDSSEITFNGVTVATNGVDITGLDLGAGAGIWNELSIHQIFSPTQVDFEVYINGTYRATVSLTGSEAADYQGLNILAVDTYAAGGGLIMDSVEITPEPATMSLLALGAIAGLIRRRK